MERSATQRCAIDPKAAMVPPRSGRGRAAVTSAAGTVSFFQGLPRVELARLVGSLEELEVPASSLLLEEGAEADGLYLPAEGACSYASAHLLRRLLPPRHVHVAALLPQTLRSLDALEAGDETRSCRASCLRRCSCGTWTLRQKGEKMLVWHALS